MLIIISNILLYILLITAIVQLIYWLGIFAKLAFYQPDSNKHTTNKPFSIIICSHNECENLQRLIPALLRQKYPCFEVIVVDDRSVDNTIVYLQKIYQTNKTLFNYLQIKQTPVGFNAKKYALMKGIEAAKFDYILLTDADCYNKSDTWVHEINQAYQHNSIEIVLGFSPYEKKASFLNALIRFETLMTAIQYLSMAIGGKAYMGVGRNLSYKKIIFKKNKGFQGIENIIGGDDDLFINKVSNKNNVNIVIAENAQMVSLPKISWKNWFRQKIRHLSVSRHYASKIKSILAVFYLSYGIYYICLLSLFFFNCHLFAMLAVYIIRILLIGYILHRCNKKLIQSYNVLLFPIMDVIYIMCLSLLAFCAYFIKRTSWT